MITLMHTFWNLHIMRFRTVPNLLKCLHYFLFIAKIEVYFRKQCFEKQGRN